MHLVGFIIRIYRNAPLAEHQNDELVWRFVGRDSDWPGAGRSGDRIPLQARLSAPVQTAPGPTWPRVQWIPGLSPGH